MLHGPHSSRWSVCGMEGSASAASSFSSGWRATQITRPQRQRHRSLDNQASAQWTLLQSILMDFLQGVSVKGSSFSTGRSCESWFGRFWVLSNLGDKVPRWSPGIPNTQSDNWQCEDGGKGKIQSFSSWRLSENFLDRKLCHVWFLIGVRGKGRTYDSGTACPYLLHSTNFVLLWSLGRRIWERECWMY